MLLEKRITRNLNDVSCLWGQIKSVKISLTSSGTQFIILLFIQELFPVKKEKKRNTGILNNEGNIQ